MRVFRLAALVVSVSVSVVPALAQTGRAVTLPFNNAQFGPTTHIPAYKPHAFLDPQRSTAQVRMIARDSISSKPTCYALRSYTFARPDAASDRTIPVGYSTCQSANSFTVRQTDGQK